MFVIALAAMLLVPMAADLTTFELDKAAARIEADILYAQSQAIHGRRLRALVFDPQQNLYYLALEDNLDEPAVDPVSKKPYLVLFAPPDTTADTRAQSYTEEFPKINLVSADFDGATVLYFDWLGLPGTAGGQPLSLAQVRIEAGDQARVLTIDPANGRVSVN